MLQLTATLAVFGVWRNLAGCGLDCRHCRPRSLSVTLGLIGMTSSEIDNAILAEKLGPGLPGGDAGYNMIAERIAALVHARRLTSQGDISRWWHSEVRVP